MQTFPCSVVWLRRDLRLRDHAALFHTVRSSQRVVCAFVLDPVLLRGPRIGAPIVSFFFDTLAELRTTLRERGSDLALLEGDAAREIPALVDRVGALAVFFNRDYEPDAIERDARTRAELERRGIKTYEFVDHVYYAADEIAQAGGKPYVVYTPYARRWRERFERDPRPPYPSLRLLEGKLASREEIGVTLEVPRSEAYGHVSSAHFPRGGESLGGQLLKRFISRHLGAYERTRNFPALDGTSALSPHLRAGTISVRTCVHEAWKARGEMSATDRVGADAWIGELIWRDFYQQILAHFPRVASVGFREGSNRIIWREDEQGFAAWCEGRTGVPIVDAAMRQLVDTGWMHNRLRMIVASYLTKDLLIDWRYGEHFFERHLADADLAANNGGWQWSSSTGTDAAPYFRIFNPARQSATFDPDGAFIRRMLPQLARVPVKYIHEPAKMPPLTAHEAGIMIGREYPMPIVDHHAARDRAIAVYGTAFGNACQNNG